MDIQTRGYMDPRFVKDRKNEEGKKRKRKLASCHQMRLWVVIIPGCTTDKLQTCDRIVMGPSGYQLWSRSHRMASLFAMKNEKKTCSKVWLWPTTRKQWARIDVVCVILASSKNLCCVSITFHRLGDPNAPKPRPMRPMSFMSVR